jgi:hypothetical protein
VLKESSNELFKHFEYWRERGIRKFVLFVASDSARTQIQEEHLRQRDRFRHSGVEFELWGAGVITNKLRAQPGIVRTYLDEHWTAILCGVGITGFPQSGLVHSILETQLEMLAVHLAEAAEKEVAELRGEWWRGQRTKAIAGLNRLHDGSRWQFFPPPLKGQILRFEAVLALASGEIEKAKQIARDASEIAPRENQRVLALIAHAEGNSDIALALLQTATEIESITLRCALLLERGQLAEASAILRPHSGNAEIHRLLSLTFLLEHDLLKARLEIEKAIQIAPTLHAVLYTRALIDYFSGLSPAVLPRLIPQWPEPENWSLVKTDDQSRGFFGSAGNAIARIEHEAELSSEERGIFETWHLACLANDPERRDDATAYCRGALNRNPGNYRLLIWALARRLDVDVAATLQFLNRQLGEGLATVSQAAAMIAWHIQAREFAQANSLLQASRQKFNESGAQNFWNFWSAQIALVAGEIPSLIETTDGNELQDEIKLITLRAQSRATGDWNGLITELQARTDRGEAQAMLELSTVLAAEKRWQEAKSTAQVMVDRISTVEALSLACLILYNAMEYEECLRLLDDRRAIFPHSQLPTELRRMRVYAQRQLGLLPKARADAEELFKNEPSKTHFLILADVFFHEGDFSSLALLGRKYEQFEDLSAEDLLRFAMRVGDTDRSTAIEHWRRALSKGISDSELSFALETGYKLGLDRELRPIVQRLTGLADTGGSNIRRVDFDELRDLLVADREDVQRVYRMYLAGEIPVHFVAHHLKRPLVLWYHQALSINQASSKSTAGPTLVRHGWRTGWSIRLDSQTQIRLHVDITALMLAAHLGILELIETAFPPIWIPHGLVIALAAMRDAAKPRQPARAQALRLVEELVTRGRIQVIEIPQDSKIPVELGRIDSNAARLLHAAKNRGWAFGEFIPLRDDRGQSIPTPNGYEATLQTAHSIVEAALRLGEISVAQKLAAFESLGPEPSWLVQQDLERNAVVLCRGPILELLAAAGVLKDVARALQLNLERNDYEAFVVEGNEGFDRAEDDRQWLTHLIDRITRGIENGRYHLMRQLEHKERYRIAAEESADAGCLLDLYLFKPASGDVIWADDRWMTGFAQRDGVPIIDTLDLLYILRDRSVISESDLLAFVHRLREMDVRLLALDVDEIKKRVSEAPISNESVAETRELRTLRSHYCRSLVNGRMLRITPSEGNPAVEWPFLLASGSAVINAIVELWDHRYSVDNARARAEWVLRSLYVPDRGRSLTSAPTNPDLDLGFEAHALGGLLSHAITLFGRDHKARLGRSEYLRWIYYRLIRNRFEADPMLATRTLDVLKALLSHTIEPKQEKERRLAGALIGLLVADMPEELSAKIAEDGEFIAGLGASADQVIRLGAHTLKTQELWLAAAAAFESKAPVAIESDGTELMVKILGSGSGQLVVEDVRANIAYVVLSSATGILSNSIESRERALRSVSELFDLPEREREEAIARVATIANVHTRVTELEDLWKNSIHDRYLRTEGKIRQHESLEESDFLPHNIHALLRHLRLTPIGEETLTVKLERSAAILIQEVGLEEAVSRLAGLPVALPEIVITRLSALAPAQRRAFLKKAAKCMGKSPLGTAHIARLFAAFAADNPSYVRYVHALMRSQFINSRGSRFTAWVAVLRFCANDFSYIEDFRRLPVQMRLSVAWAHGDRLFRMLTNLKVDNEWIQDHFENSSARLATEIAFADDIYTTDVAHPNRLSSLGFALSSISYASQFGNLLDDDLKQELSSYIENRADGFLALAYDVSLAPDSMTSFFIWDQRPTWLSVLTAALQESLSPAELRSQVIAALAGISEGQQELFGVLQVIVRDHPVPPDLEPSLAQALLAADFTNLQKTNPQSAYIAAAFTARHAGRLGTAVLEHVRAQLITLAQAQSGTRDDNDNTFASMIFSAVFSLYAHSERDSRFDEIARLLEEVVVAWPAAVNPCRQLVERLITHLPNRDSRWFWALKIRLCAGN